MTIARTALLLSASALALAIGGSASAQDQVRDAAAARAEAAEIWNVPAHEGQAAAALATNATRGIPEGGVRLTPQNSIGRGWDYPVYDQRVTENNDPRLPDATPPEGIVPLERDLFSTDNFWLDEDLWMDPRYWRCNSTRQLADMRAGGPGVGTPDPRIGRDPPLSARWGDCSHDYPLTNIVSPYPFNSAEEHYNALLAETQANGGPTVYTRENPPPYWDGDHAERDRTFLAHGRPGQIPTFLAMLTPEYRTYTVQQSYHEAVNSGHQWNAAYCYPEGLLRGWATGPKPSNWVVTPELAMRFNGSSSNTRRIVWTSMDSHEDMGSQFAQWMGDTIGFWDGDVLVSWTANVQGWTMHSTWEWSNSLETIEIFSPIYNAAGEHWGILEEMIMYDPESLMEPTRAVREWRLTGRLPDSGRIPFVECIRNFFPDEGGFQNPVTPGSIVTFRFPNMYDRPWAQIWEEFFEQDMPRPGEETIDNGFDLGIFAGR